MADLLNQRRQWFSFFPEGSLEFLVVTRVLALLLAGTLVIVPSTQRPAVLVALGAMVWLDYALIMWWLLEVAGDLREVFAPSARPAGHERLRTGMIVLIPSVLAFLLLAPWAQFLIRRASTRGPLLMVLVPVLSAAYLASLPLAYRRLKRAGLPGGVWTVLLFVPVVHWLALHRLLKPLHARVRDRAIEQGLPVSSETGAGAAAGAADVLVVVCAVFWVLWGVLLAAGRSGGGLLSLVQAASIGAGCLLAVTQVAALEYLQRRFVALIRRARPPGERVVAANAVEEP